ncbi:aldehyde dehydrogenase family protein [Rhizobium leguminosarum]|uniref:aldehyde dehydrogenase family protein n=1 Tax=Rhizobium leguminosarum TaxID=384 RepID=UPI0021B0A174|nr:aldehyde dehydrogenase family protein [Rhizobium leguminosarum]
MRAKDSPFIGTKFTENEKVRKLTFTGATNVGKVLMSQGVNEIMKRCAELGGNAPFIVFRGASRRVRA